MRKIYTFVLLSFSLAFAASAVTVTPPALESGSTSVYTMSCDNVTLKINAATGGRITSVRISDPTNPTIWKRNTIEVLSQLSGINEHGSTFWPSPQASWNPSWPPMPVLDNGPYTVSIEGNVITLTSGLENQNSFKLRISKKIQFNPTDTSIIIDYKITNENDLVQSWAPWEVTRVASSGITVFKKGDGNMTGPLFTNNSPSLFTEQYGNQWYNYGKNIGTSGGEKMMSDGAGWLAHVPTDKTRILIKRFNDVALTAVAPGESEVQIYTSQNNTYTELENQGAYVAIQPGASLTYTVRWYCRVLPFTSTEVASPSGTALITNFVNNVITKGDLVAGINKPTAETTTISVNSTLDIMTVETNLTSYNKVEFVAFDLQGKVVLRQALTDSQQQFPVKGLSKGSYLYQINNGSASIAKGKFMINR